MRALFAPMRPEFDNFLYAAVGEEVDGMPLSVISVLTRLDLDPWDEAARLASLAKRDATEQLAELIAKLPATPRRSIEAGRIADGLIRLLPQHNKAAAIMPVRSANIIQKSSNIIQRKASLGELKVWLIGLILGAAVLVSLAAHGGLTFGSHQFEMPSVTARDKN